MRGFCLHAGTTQISPAEGSVVAVRTPGKTAEPFGAGQNKCLHFTDSHHFAIQTACLKKDSSPGTLHLELINVHRARLSTQALFLA